jgi:hypothetical protein
VSSSRPRPARTIHDPAAFHPTAAAVHYLHPDRHAGPTQVLAALDHRTAPRNDKAARSGFFGGGFVVVGQQSAKAGGEAEDAASDQERQKLSHFGSIDDEAGHGRNILRSWVNKPSNAGEFT